ncbi:MAG TPA: dethiobiotin synthase [Pelomicrobium sp.]|nr:dethiobiotin synthase [Pelomicrobium sp.]
MADGWFVTGTDTEVGKTLIAAAMIITLRRRGMRIAPMKPVVAGIEGGTYRDVDCLMAAAGGDYPAALVSPYRFEAPIAPHIAAAAAGVEIEPARILAAFAALRSGADAIVVEGAGGFRVPLGPGFDFADLAQRLALPVVLVVRIRLGCINHALLTAEAIERRGLLLAGWIANAIDPAMPVARENIAALAERLPAPLLGEVPLMARPHPEQAADYLGALTRLTNPAPLVAAAHHGSN